MPGISTTDTRRQGAKVDITNKPWSNDRNDVRYWGNMFSKATNMQNPVAHGLTMGALGLGAGYLMKPLFRRLYPEFNADRMPWVLGAGAGLGSGWLSSAMNKKSNIDHNDPYGRNIPLNPAVISPMTRYMQHVGQVGPATALAMREATNRTSYNGNSSPSGFNRVVNSALNAAQTYLSPAKRMGWAAAGLGAGIVSNAIGMENQLQKTLGMGASQAVRTYGPGLQLMRTGMQLAGGF